MAFSGKLLARFGIKPLLLAAFCCCVARWFAYGVVHDYRLALLFQPLHGFTFAIFYVAGVTFMEQRVPPLMPVRICATERGLRTAWLP